LPQLQPGNLKPCSPAHRIIEYRDFPKSENWRAWGFRTWRLQRYFANTPPEALNSPDGDKG
jgi:hypothetical protein